MPFPQIFPSTFFSFFLAGHIRMKLFRQGARFTVCVLNIFQHDAKTKRITYFNTGEEK